MSTQSLTATNFDEVAESNDAVIVDFWASWCGPCRAFAPTFEKVSQNHPDIVFGKVDTDAELELAQRFSISSIPTIMAIRGGVVVFSQPGVLSESALEKLITEVKRLDLAEVQATARPE